MRWTMIMVTAFLVTTGAVAQDNDAFQQLSNYLTTGDPLQEANGIATARIYDRTGCVSGMDDSQGGYVRIFWNNVDPAAIEVKYHYIPGDEYLGTTGDRILVLILAGDETVVDAQAKNGLLYLSLVMTGVTPGRHSRVMLPVYNLDPDRLRRALDILYARHCTGTKSAAAF